MCGKQATVQCSGFENGQYRQEDQGLHCYICNSKLHKNLDGLKVMLLRGLSRLRGRKLLKRNSHALSIMHFSALWHEVFTQKAKSKLPVTVSNEIQYPNQ